MKILITFFMFSFSITMFSQAPVIEGDQFVCINTNGIATVTNDIIYDTYQWYSKLTYDENAIFEEIIDATSDTYSYNFMMNEYTIKVVTTLNNVTYESNTIDLELPYDNGLAIDDEIIGEGFFTGDFFEICEGSTLIFSVPSIFSANVEWYKNDVLLENETSDTLTITEPGIYYAKSSREFCPLDFKYSEILVVYFENCGTADTENNKFKNTIEIFPNPANDLVYFENKNNVPVTKYEIFSIDGKRLISQEVSEDIKSISLENLSTGSYIIKFYGKNQVASRKIIKK